MEGKLMNTYRVVFTNGEERELIVEADTFSEHENQVVFYKGKQPVAAVSRDKFLYTEKVE